MEHSPMRTLLIHQAFVSPQEAGGTRHYEFAKHVQNAGDQFVIVASNLSYLTGKSAVKSKRVVMEQDVEGIKVLRAYTLPALHRSFFWRILSFLSFMFTSIYAGLRAGPIDIVMGTSPPIFQAVSAWLIAFLRRRPFLLEVRDLWPEFAIGMGVLTNPVLIKLSRWLESFLYARASHLLVNSPAYRDYLINKGVPSTKVTLIPNGVDPTMFTPDNDGKSIREAFGLNGHFVATYAGALGMANDINTVLRAASHLQNERDIHFLLVGDGKERKNLESLAKELQLTNVTFVGSRPKSEMKDFLAASNVCLATLQDIPMFRTTYPNKVFDYMAAGRPIVLAIDGVIREVVEAAEGGVFVPPGDELRLAEALTQLSKNPVRCEAMGSRARSYVVAHFNRQQHAEDFLQVLKYVAI